MKKPYLRRLFWDAHSAIVGLVVAACVGLVGALLVIGARSDRETRPTVLEVEDLRAELRVGRQGLGDALSARTGSRLVLDPHVVNNLAFHAVLTNRGGNSGDLPSNTAIDIVRPTFDARSMETSAFPYAQLIEGRKLAPVGGSREQSAVELRTADQRPITLTSGNLGWTVQTREAHGRGWSPPRRVEPTVEERDNRQHWIIPLRQLTPRLKQREQIRITFQTWATVARKGVHLALDAQARLDGQLGWRNWNLPVRSGSDIESLLMVSNLGTRSAHQVVVRSSLPPGAALIPLSARTALPNQPAPEPVTDNLVNGGLRFRTMAPGATGYFLIRTKIKRLTPDTNWLKHVWVIRAVETRGIDYWDSVKLQVRLGAARGGRSAPPSAVNSPE